MTGHNVIELELNYKPPTKTILNQYQYLIYELFFNTSFDLYDAGSKIWRFFKHER